MTGTRFTPRLGIACAAAAVFVLFFLSRLLRNEYPALLEYQPVDSVESFTTEGLPDLSHYKTLRILPEDEFPSDLLKPGRVIILGDIHGMNQSLHKLLHKVSYDPASDKLIHVGDLVTKSRGQGSFAVLSFMSRHNIPGVRGNHDQKVLEWRSWLDWISSQKGGRAWLQEIDADWPKAKALGVALDTWMAQHKDRSDKFWDLIPHKWKLFSEHYRIARDMSAEDYTYLLSLPLTLYVPSAHAYIVHAGLLPFDPRLPPSHPTQPLSHAPRLPRGPDIKSARESQKRLMRRLQEEAILNNIPQNGDPWVLLNMRGVINSNKTITRGHGGTPWTKLWNADMSRCSGFPGASVEASNKKDKPLPCLPSTVVYGHAASRGLDAHRWTVGLDSGCVYGRRLSALVLGEQPKSEADRAFSHDDGTDRTIPFGDGDEARIASVSCDRNEG